MFWHVCSDSQWKIYAFLCAWLFVVVQKIKQFPILLGCHNSMGANSYAIKMWTIFLTPIFSFLLPWRDKMGTFLISSALDHPSLFITAWCQGQLRRVFIFTLFYFLLDFALFLVFWGGVPGFLGVFQVFWGVFLVFWWCSGLSGGCSGFFGLFRGVPVFQCCWKYYMPIVLHTAKRNEMARERAWKGVPTSWPDHCYLQAALTWLLSKSSDLQTRTRVLKWRKRRCPLLPIN